MCRRTSSSRRLLPIALAPVLLLAACGDDSTDSSDTLADLQPSSYVVREPATTTTTLAGGSVPVDEEGRSPVEQEYEIESGDYPLGVADRFGITLDQLVNYNEWASANAFPFPGTVIKIPPGALVPAAADDTDTADTVAPETDETDAPDTETTQAGLADNCIAGSYVIEAGDYPGLVAGKFDVTVAQLEAANVNTEGYASFFVGLEIVIPEKDCA
jgi:LysM repeat protein